jgi:hypothetical protein
MDARVKPAHDSDGCAVIIHAAELVAQSSSTLPNWLRGHPPRCHCRA